MRVIRATVFSSSLDLADQLAFVHDDDVNTTLEAGLVFDETVTF